jgi:hypothetical protein
MRPIGIACWVTKATDVHSENVIHTASLRQQWLRERASVLRYTISVPVLRFIVLYVIYP